MTALRKQIGLRMRELRRARKLTQEQLGELAGLSYKFVGEVERGIANPTIDSLADIADALNVDIADLVGPQPSIVLQKLTPHDYSVVREVRDSLNSIVSRYRKSRKRQK